MKILKYTASFSSLSKRQIADRLKTKSIKSSKQKQVSEVGHTYPPPHVVVKMVADDDKHPMNSNGLPYAMFEI